MLITLIVLGAGICLHMFELSKASDRRQKLQKQLIELKQAYANSQAVCTAQEQELRTLRGKLAIQGMTKVASIQDYSQNSSLPKDEIP